MKQVKFKKRVPNKLEGRLQIFELKQMADMKDVYKKICRQAIKNYKIWLRGYQAETDIISLLYGRLEGDMLRHQAEDSIKLYWTLRCDFRRSFKEYLEKNCCYPSAYNQSKAA